MKYKIIKIFPSALLEYKVGDIISENSHPATFAIAFKWPEYFEEVKEPLFITEDGINIYDKDIVWKVEDFLVCKFIAYSQYSPYNIRSYSTKEKAEEYILINKPSLSIKDIQLIIGQCNNTNYINLNLLTHKLKELVKIKI